MIASKHKHTIKLGNQTSGFELNVSRSRNAIYFSIIAMPSKSHFPIFAIQNFMQNTKNTWEFHLYCWDHVWKVNECCLVDCFRCKSRVSIQILIRNYCNAKCIKYSACDRLLGHFFVIHNFYVNSNPGTPYC